MQFLKRIYSFWAETYKTSKALFFAEAAGAILGMFSASYLALNPIGANMWLVLLPWGISAMFMVYAAYKRESAWMILIMLFYVVMNFTGIIKLILG